MNRALDIDNVQFKNSIFNDGQKNVCFTMITVHAA